MLSTSSVSDDHALVCVSFQVDGQSLMGKENPESLKILKASGTKTVLKLRRRKQKNEGRFWAHRSMPSVEAWSLQVTLVADIR